MDIFDKIKQAGGMVAAPILFNINRIVKNSQLAHWALEMDPQYLPAFQMSGLDDEAKAQIVRFQVASQLTANVTPKAVQSVLELLPKSRSQYLQDVFCALALDQAHNGFFVEVGVGSGERISNTFMLEKEFNWKGLLIEPNRTFHDSIRACRAAKLDVRAAASKTGEILQFEEFTGAGEFSRIAGAKSHDMSRQSVIKYDVETVSLTDALAEVKAPAEIDFISIDTEGTEIDILNGINFAEQRFKVMVIEHNNRRKVQAAYEEILSPHGYRRVMHEVSGVDAYFVHRSLELNAFNGGI